MMKLILRCLMIAFLCHAVGLHAQRKPKIKGNRDVIQVTEALPPFSKLELIDDLDIELRRAAEESYFISADDNLIDVIKFRVNDGTLVISSFYEITAKKELTIVISYNQLNAITISEGRLTTGEGEKINSDLLSIKATGNSRLNLEADAGEFRIAMEDNSKGDFTVTADSLSIHIQDKADTHLYVNSSSGSVTLWDGATLTLEGTSDNMDLTLAGNGKMKAEDFEVGELTASLSDSSDARLFARDLLRLSLSGTSRCYLFGDPVISLSSFKDNAEFFKRNK